MKHTWLGIDGGSTKTAAALVDSEGRVLARVLAGRSGILGKPGPGPKAVLRGVVDSLLRQSGLKRADLGGVGLGLSGIDFDDEIKMQHRELSRTLAIPPAKLTLVNDGIIALWGLTDRARAVLVQHGTGYTAAYRREPGREGLFDHLSVGLPFDMRFAVLGLVARMIDGREERTPLKAAVLKRLGVQERDFADKVYRNRIPRDRVMNTPDLVYRAWLKGDRGAAKLVGLALEDYALAAVTMARKLGPGPVVVGFGGGILNRAPQRFRGLLAKKVRRALPQATVALPILAPELGACLMAARAQGEDSSALFARMANAA